MHLRFWRGSALTGNLDLRPDCSRSAGCQERNRIDQVVDLLGANVNLAGAELDLIGMSDREVPSEKRTRSGEGRLRLCIYRLSAVTRSADAQLPVCSRQASLVPLRVRVLCTRGLSQLMTTVRMVKKALNRKLVMEGVLLTMFDGRTNLSIQVVEEVKKHFPGEVFSAVVPRNVRLSEAPSTASHNGIRQNVPRRRGLSGSRGRGF